MSEKKPVYIQVMSPRLEDTIAKLEMAKGADRSWAEYAKESGVNPSTLSRVINGKLNSPLSIKTLEKLYEHRAGTCKLTFDSFILASGMVDREKQCDMVNHQRALQDEITENSKRIEKSIVNSLYARDLSFSRMDKVESNGENDDEIDRLFGNVDCSQLLRIGDGNNGKSYGFEYVPLLFEDDDDDVEKHVSRIVRMAVENYATIFLEDAWGLDNRLSDCVTFVFADRRLYEAFLASFAKRRLNHYMTVLLVDIKESEVVEEQPLGAQDGKEFSSLFDAPITERNMRRFGENINRFEDNQ